MKIAIEARALSNPGTGVATYARELIRSLVERGGHDITVLYDNARHRNSFAVEEQIVPLLHQMLLPAWLRFSLPHALRRIKPDVVHFTKADVPAQKRYPTVVTIFDVIPLLFPQSQSAVRRRYWPRALARAAAASDHILTISQTSKKDIVTHLGVDSGRVTVTPLAVDTTRFRPVDKARIEQIRSRLNLRGPIVLFVGTRDTRKNVPALVRAFASIAGNIPHTLVLAGQAAKKPDTTETAIRRLGLDRRVHILNYVADDDLPGLYSAAELFIYPSVYEGWGFPPQEAMACGTPVIVSNGGALPEVVGQAGAIVPFAVDQVSERILDRDFEQRLARQILTLLNDRQALHQLGQRGQERARRLSWAQVMHRTLAVYQQVANGQ